MPFNRLAPAGLLFFVGTLLAAGNVWYSAGRSTIPLSIDGVVARKTLLTEHTPGLDDVCLLTLDDGSTLQVDKPIYDAVSLGDPLHKAAWSKLLRRGYETIGLDWSRDARRMIWVMPLTLVLLATLVPFAIKRK